MSRNSWGLFTICFVIVVGVGQRCEAQPAKPNPIVATRVDDPNGLAGPHLVRSFVLRIRNPEEGPRLTRLKPADSELRRLIAIAHARSSTFRALVAEIDRSNAIVVMAFGFCASGRFRSCVTHVEGNARQRHVAIKIHPGGMEHRLIGSIAHELYHALEILRDPDVMNRDGVIALYRRISFGKCKAGLSEECETQAALDVEAQVLEEYAERVAQR